MPIEYKNNLPEVLREIDSIADREARRRAQAVGEDVGKAAVKATREEMARGKRGVKWRGLRKRSARVDSEIPASQSGALERGLEHSTDLVRTGRGYDVRVTVSTKADREGVKTHQAAAWAEFAKYSSRLGSRIKRAVSRALSRSDR